MTFLSKVGSIVAKGLEIWLGLEPIFAANPQVAAVAPVVDSTFAKISRIVIDAEAFGNIAGLKGPQKAAAAGPLVAQVLGDLFKDTKVDPAKLQTASITLSGAVADVWNAVDESAVAVKSIKS